MEEKKAAAAPVALLERLIDRVPYFDGSGRRRLVTGVVFSLGAGLILWHTYRVQVSGISFKDMLESPVSVILSLLVLFAIGGLVEMIGEFFLVRAASGIVWSTSFPKRFTRKCVHRGSVG